MSKDKNFDSEYTEDQWSTRLSQVNKKQREELENLKKVAEALYLEYNEYKASKHLNDKR